MSRPPDGPFEAREWPDKLTARVTDLEGRIHGFEAESDLAQHYAFSDLVFLASCGELPDEASSRAFGAALIAISPAPVQRAPTHAATLVQRCGGAPSAVIAVAATGLAEEIRSILDEGLFAWLEGGAKEPPPIVGRRAESEPSGPNPLNAVAGTGPWSATLESFELNRAAAALAVMFQCGLRSRAQLEAAVVIARLPVACAEAFAAPRGQIRDYPQRLPDFDYVEVP
ncbi:MAG: hypothetical protein HYV07_28120 [Deltaproteobacteria bacterium]|nr:hypothetical protein [Deltaproteobacteria bacterium]